MGAVPSGDPATRPSNWLTRDFVVGSRTTAAPPRADPDAPPPEVERPTVLLMGTTNDDPRVWLEAGRALARMLLRLGYPAERGTPSGRRPVSGVLRAG